MSLFIGMDEAGYGPNLGPLVITATAWDLPANPRECDVWKLLSDVVSQDGWQEGKRLHIADSKDVYSTAKGLKSLETSVHCILQLAGVESSTFKTLWRQLAVHFPEDDVQEPWFVDDLPLPVLAAVGEVNHLADRLANCVATAGIGRPRLRSDVVLTDRFNRLNSQHNSKGVTLSTLSLSLLRTLWEPSNDDAALIVADKHGGRNRYDGLLAEILDGEMIFRVEEGRERSTYRIGETEVRFQMKAEAHFPVAVASLVSKYLREIAMLSFNRFWRTHLPDLKATQGYPVDARRFKADIAEKQAELAIPDQILWRDR
ncbi:MAG: hypothetical protein KDA93_12145 [Planctomycetaceae bacterium]|nr:hypothetical protein [Planctomycetaceae bacterium]